MDSKFALLKECVLKELSKLYFNPTTLVDIPDLQKYLYDKLDAKSLSTLYRTEPVHVGKKLPVLATGIKGQPGSGNLSDEEAKKFKTAWEGKGVPNAKNMLSKLHWSR